MFFVILFAEDGRQGTDAYLKIEDWQRHCTSWLGDGDPHVVDIIVSHIDRAL